MNAPTVATVAVLGLIALGIHLLDRYLHSGGGSGRAKVDGARWAARRDLRGLRVSAAEPGRLVLGRQGRHLIAAEERASVVVVGPSRTSLKTSGFAIPALLEWQGPVLATSVKTDLLAATIERRRQLGEAMVFDPAAVSGFDSIKATPLASCGSWRGAMRVAHWLCGSARTGGSGGLEDAAFWYAAAEKLIAPLLLTAAKTGGQMADVLRWLDEGPEAEETVTEKLEGIGCAEAVRAWEANWNREERQRSSIYTTAETVLGAYADPLVQAASSAPEYTPASLIDGKANTLYLCAPAHEQERLRTVFTAMISELVAVVYELAAKTGEPINPPLLIVLDEAANIAAPPELDVIASSGAGQGIQLVTVFQDLAQVSARYGNRAQTIINNHRARAFCAGIGDPETLGYVSQIVGDAEYRQRSETAGERGYSTATEASAYRDLAPANVVRGAEPGSALLIYGHLPPARLRLRPWFEDGRLRDLAEGRER